MFTHTSSMIRPVLLSLLSTTVLLSAAPTPPSPTLTLGSPAPALATGKWIRGKAVNTFEKDKVYIIDFWSTKNTFSKASLPHLEKLHKEFKDKGVVFIAQNCQETDDKMVTEFMKKVGPRLSLRVSLDDKSKDKQGSMLTTWVTAAGHSTLPITFIIDRTGKIAWIGRPTDINDEMLSQLLAGTFDSAAAAAKQVEMEKTRTRMREKMGRIQPLMKQQKWDEALAAVEDLEKDIPEENKLLGTHLRMTIAIGKKEDKKAADLALTISQDAQMRKNATNLALLAQRLLSGEGLGENAAQAALKIARLAQDKSHDQDMLTLSTLAAAYHANGMRDKAVATQKKAIAAAPLQLKERFTKALEEYKKGLEKKEEN